ncbi:pimeloyl-ACP methyl ester carboxylesterase [Nocardia sp. GAS34]|uniref:alpha/beta fold hydrolase n=1 Tax=unclassified Nocardia TaxID=2637762 RepID=UPI003D20EF6E
MIEQSADVGRGITLTYQRFRADGSPLVLIAGLGQQLHEWPDDLCRILAERGFDVVRFDNRDVGTSTHLPFPPPAPPDLLRRRWHRDQYDVGDMATDTVGLLDALGFERAHLAGMSMGGMIAQTVAARHRGRVASLTSIISGPGGFRYGRPAWSTWRYLLGKPARSRDEHVDRAERIYRHIGSAGYPFDAAAVRATAGRVWDRDPRPAPGSGRQLSAIMKSGNRTRELTRITTPTLVLHGDRDRMVHPSGGAATARAVPGARRHTLPGMGHDLPAELWPTLADLIHDHIRAAESASPTHPR